MSRDDYAGRDDDASREAGGDAGSDAGPGLDATASPFVPVAQARRDAASSPEGAAARAAENKSGRSARAPADKDGDDYDHTPPDPPSLAQPPNQNLVCAEGGGNCCPPARHQTSTLRQRL